MLLQFLHIVIRCPYIGRATPIIWRFIGQIIFLVGSVFFFLNDIVVGAVVGVDVFVDIFPPKEA